jgi:hypothetical protein
MLDPAAPAPRRELPLDGRPLDASFGGTSIECVAFPEALRHESTW